MTEPTVEEIGARLEQRLENRDGNRATLVVNRELRAIIASRRKRGDVLKMLREPYATDPKLYAPLLAQIDDALKDRP